MKTFREYIQYLFKEEDAPPPDLGAAPPPGGPPAGGPPDMGDYIKEKFPQNTNKSK